jgi:hypothetical protein
LDPPVTMATLPSTRSSIKPTVARRILDPSIVAAMCGMASRRD